MNEWKVWFVRSLWSGHLAKPALLLETGSQKTHRSRLVSRRWLDRAVWLDRAASGPLSRWFDLDGSVEPLVRSRCLGLSHGSRSVWGWFQPWSQSQPVRASATLGSLNT